jgi:hypothetical protein
MADSGAALMRGTILAERAIWILFRASVIVFPPETQSRLNILWAPSVNC